jgi:hypothetical protein
MSLDIAVIEELVQCYCRDVDQVHGIFLDGTMAMGELARQYIQLHTAHLDKLQDDDRPIRLDEIDPTVVYMGQVDNAPTELHSTTLDSLITRNMPSGDNWVFLGQMCIVQIYQLWEDHYRQRLAHALGVAKSEIQAEVFGELKGLRNSIIHHGGRAKPSIANLRILRSFPVGDMVALGPHDMRDLVAAVKRGSRLVLCVR